MTEEAENLYKEINAFTLWADNNFPMWDEEHDNGEWEIGTDNHFDEMVSAASEVISNIDFTGADEVLIDAMLFAVARDNEREMLADQLLKHEGCGNERALFWTMWDGFDPDNEEHRNLSDVAYIEVEGLKWRAV